MRHRFGPSMIAQAPEGLITAHESQRVQRRQGKVRSSQARRAERARRELPSLRAPTDNRAVWALTSA
jgi:hypothetical protein